MFIEKIKNEKFRFKIQISNSLIRHIQYIVVSLNKTSQLYFVNEQHNSMV